jgi:arylformamidase
VAALPLDPFIGAATVIDARGLDALDDRALDRMRAGAGKAAGGGKDEAPTLRGARLLFRTRESVDAREFPASFVAFDPAFARRLADAGVALVGTDAPSVDTLDSKTLDAHHAFASGGVAILENAVLDDVAPGSYLLVALPLKLVEADSSPVRAVLVEDARGLLPEPEARLGERRGP